MPLFDLTLPAGALPRSALTTLIEGLTTTALHWEGIPDTPASRAMAWSFVHEPPCGAVNVGGRPAELPIYRIDLTVPEGSLGLHGPLNEQRRNPVSRRVLCRGGWTCRARLIGSCCSSSSMNASRGGGPGDAYLCPRGVLVCDGKGAGRPRRSSLRERGPVRSRCERANGVVRCAGVSRPSHNT